MIAIQPLQLGTVAWTLWAMTLIAFIVAMAYSNAAKLPWQYRFCAMLWTITGFIFTFAVGITAQAALT